MPPDQLAKTRVLLTAAGGGAPLEMIRSLRERGGYEIIGADANRYSAAFPIVDRGYCVPMGADPLFVEAARALLLRELPHFIVSTVDEELPIFHQLITELGISTQLVAPRLDFCRLALDKWEMAQSMSRLDLPTARTWLACDATDAIFPAVVKPRSGRGSRGVAFVDSREDLESYLHDAISTSDRYIVQERLIGVEMTTSVVVTLDGKLLAVVPKEAVEKRGITRVGVTRRVPEVEQMCTEIQEKLRANGPFNVQLIMGADRVPRVFEINPRFSTTTALTIAAGVDEVDVVMRAARGLEPGPLAFREGVMMIRHDAQTYVSEEDWNVRQLLEGRVV